MYPYSMYVCMDACTHINGCMSPFLAKNLEKHIWVYSTKVAEPCQISSFRSFCEAEFRQQKYEQTPKNRRGFCSQVT